MKKIITISSAKIKAFNNILSSVMFMLLFIVTGMQYSTAQTCSGTANIPPNGTVSINSVTITSTSTGSVLQYVSGNTSCGNVTTDPNALWLGQTGAFGVTLDFSLPVNNVIFVINGTGTTIDENFIFNTNGGIPSISSTVSCYSTIVGNEILSGLGAPSTAGGVFMITRPSPFTQITITGSGGDGGSLVGICTSSLAAACNAGVTAPTLSASTKANVCPATTVNLTTITASNLPGSTTLTWHTGTPATTANKVTGTAVAAGTYYAAFFDATNNCYSGTGGNGSATTTVTATVAACCVAGTSAPTLSASTKANVCPATTVNLTTITASNLPGGTTLTWHTGTPATTANKVTGTTVAAGTYYAAFFDATANCYSGTGGNGSATTTVTATVAVCCVAGTSAPTLSASTKANVCPATTVDLTTITASNLPGSTTLTWHTGTPATTANKVTGTAVAAGTYYAAFFDATNNCYSGTGGNGSATTTVTATVSSCITPVTVGTPAVISGVTGTTITGNPPTSVSGGTAPYTYSNGAGDPLCTSPTSPTLTLPSGKITGLNSSTGAHSVNLTGVSPGTYQYCIKVCDSTGTNCDMSIHIVTVTGASCNAGSVAPSLIKN